MSFDIFKRVRNMVYTTSGDYDVGVSMSGKDSYTDTKKVTVATAQSFVDMGLTEQESTEVVMHAAAHEGAHVRYSTMDGVNEIVKQARKDGADLEQLNAMVQVAEDYRVDNAVAKERPGYWETRSNAINSAIKLFKERPSENATFNFGKALSFFTHDIDLREVGWSKSVLDWDDVKQTAEDLKDIARESSTSTELVDSVYKYYKSKYSIEPPDSSEDSEGGGDGEGDSDGSTPDDTDGDSGDVDGKSGSDGDSTSKGGKSSGGKSSDSSDKSDDTDSDKDSTSDSSSSKSSASKSSTSKKSTESTESGEGGGFSVDYDETAESDVEKALEELEKSFSGADTVNDMIGDKAKRTLDGATTCREKSSAESLKRRYTEIAKGEYEKLTGCIGKCTPIWSEQERTTFMENNCVGAHSGADVLYCTREDTGKILPTYETSRLDGTARKLGNMLIQTLKAEANNQGEITSSGSRVIANKMWKPVHTGNPNVFYQKNFDETGGYVIDLVLDASGSQHGREDRIREQAYIIASACSRAGIPCRVTQFRNRSTFTVLERLRDFDDPASENRNCGKYSAGGDNRDGLAILIANHDLQKRSEPNKVMIVLSDGAPQDSSGTEKIDAFGGIGYYSFRSVKDGGTCPILNDVYNIIRKIRKSGTAVMGIYVGSGYCDDTLKAEQAMYGSDFAYIRSMDTFVDIVMKYLVRHIQGFDK